MHQLRPGISARDCEIPHRERIRLKRGHGLFFGEIDLIVRGWIEDYFWFRGGNCLIHRRCVGDIARRAIESRDLVPAFGKLGLQFHTKLPLGPEDRDLLHYWMARTFSKAHRTNPAAPGSKMSSQSRCSARARGRMAGFAEVRAVAEFAASDDASRVRNPEGSPRNARRISW